jgi:hypothetical protein
VIILCPGINHDFYSFQRINEAMTEMDTIFDRGPSAHIVMALAASCLVVAIGCDASEGTFKNDGKVRVRNCQQAGVTGDELKVCSSTDDGYKRIMEPIRARREGEEAAAYNKAIQALPSRTIPKDRYESISLEVLKKNKCCIGEFTDAIEAPKHTLYGKRLSVKGRMVYFPPDYENKSDEHQWLELQDTTSQKDAWQLEADIESLSREERAHIRANCHFDDCSGKFYGVIGRLVKTRGLEVLGLQVEHIELSPREAKKPS